MVDVSELGTSFAQGFTGILPQVMKYIGYLFWGVLILEVCGQHIFCFSISINICMRSQDLAEYSV